MSYHNFKETPNQNILNTIIEDMGKLGKTTRIIGPILGGYLTFASVQNKVTALEQIEINQLKKVYRLMGL